MSELMLRPGLRLGNYPQKSESRLSLFEQRAEKLFDKARHAFSGNRYSQAGVVAKVDHYAKSLKNCTENALTIAYLELQQQLHNQGLIDELIFQAFAIIREAAVRTLGKRHYDEQLFGGWLMINGMLAEMATGEGKTLTTTLPACTAALAGIPVHVITANDYLATRDAGIMRPLYERLGLKASSVVDGMETEQRRKNYQCHIVHTTNKQIAFDYLRDRIATGHDLGLLSNQFQQIKRERNPEQYQPLLLRGLCFALVDEADSVLIDEAKTPLIISQLREDSEDSTIYNDAMYLASSLLIDEDFILDSKNRDIELTEHGEITLDELISSLPSTWQNPKKNYSLIKLALVAEYLYQKDKHYIVEGDKVKIVDEFTGRIMADRAWENGLQQMIEAKEGCLISEQREPLARISYQRFFSRYLRLGGTSGTLKEVAAELHSLYGLHTVSVATHKPSQRLLMPERIFRTAEIKQQVFLARIAQLYEQKRPVLIGTSAVSESEKVSGWLSAAGFPHRVLNAKQDQFEADIIAKAGKPQAITVATNMAGRGTDIALGIGVFELGGLHIIALNSNESRRLDRQLYGRCARQGDPGSVEAILSLEDPALKHLYTSAMLNLLGWFCKDNRAMPNLLANWLLRFPQKHNEKRQRQLRSQLMKQDRQLAKLLAFSGKFE